MQLVSLGVIQSEKWQDIVLDVVMTHMVNIEEVMRMNELVTVALMLKGEGMEYTQITPKMLGQLAVAIKEKGSESITFSNRRTIETVGFMVYSKQIGERIIMTGQGGKLDE